jgi:flagellar hook-basal body complex protein FliE
MVSSDEMIDNAVRPETASFDQTLLSASTRITRSSRRRTRSPRNDRRPESVDVHDVTIAMAEGAFR